MASCFAGMIREIAEASLDCKKRRELEALMKNGVRRNDKTGLDFSRAMNMPRSMTGISISKATFSFIWAGERVTCAML